MVIPATTIQVQPRADQFVMELWRAGAPRPDKVAAIELIAVENPSAPLQFAKRIPTTR